MRAIIWAFVVSGLTIVATEQLYRRAGGLPSIVPGLTRVEYQWKMQQTIRQRHVAYVVGDSRAGWGFAERVFNREYTRLDPSSKTMAVNAGVPAASIGGNVKYLLDLRAGIRPQALIVNFSPVGIYLFLNHPGPPIPGLKVQDVLDDRIDSALAETLWTRGRPQSVAEQVIATRQRGRVWPAANWVHRTIFGDGFINGTLGTNNGSPLDAATFELEFFQQFVRTVRQSPMDSRKRKEEFVDLLHRAGTTGWTVVLVRFPIGKRMRQVEADLPADLQPAAVAADLEVPLLDYNSDPRTSEFPTLDESHLTPDAARALAPILARDFVRFLH